MLADTLHSLRQRCQPHAELYKVASINLCPNTMGQIAVGLMCNEPRPGAPSYDGFEEEKGQLSASLRRKAHMLTDFFNGLPGVSCNFTEGAMYSFPRITCAPRLALRRA